jgi:hypothetical protein
LLHLLVDRCFAQLYSRHRERGRKALEQISLKCAVLVVAVVVQVLPAGFLLGVVVPVVILKYFSHLVR